MAATKNMKSCIGCVLGVNYIVLSSVYICGPFSKTFLKLNHCHLQCGFCNYILEFKCLLYSDQHYDLWA